MISLRLRLAGQIADSNGARGHAFCNQVHIQNARRSVLSELNFDSSSRNGRTGGHLNTMTLNLEASRKAAALSLRGANYRYQPDLARLGDTLGSETNQRHRGSRTRKTSCIRSI